VDAERLDPPDEHGRLCNLLEGLPIAAHIARAVAGVIHGLASPSRARAIASGPPRGVGRPSHRGRAGSTTPPPRLV
jgi:hypothetical protein